MEPNQKADADKVVSLHGVSYVSGEPQEDVIALLKELLESAEKGEVLGIAVAVVSGGPLVNGEVAFGSAGPLILAAALKTLEYHFMKRWQE